MCYVCYWGNEERNNFSVTMGHFPLTLSPIKLDIPTGFVFRPSFIFIIYASPFEKYNILYDCYLDNTQFHK